MNDLLKRVSNVYFIGIGGIGMSALARWFVYKGKNVAGYDSTPTPLTQQLTDEGIVIHYVDDIAHIPQSFIENSFTLLAIYTPAIPTNHREINFFRQKHIKLWKRSEILGLIANDNFNIAVAGTHGKTTTASMIAHILKACQQPVSAFLGGIATNYQSNLVLANNNVAEEIILVEADEYDRSFLQLRPNSAVITAIEPDHLDIYGSIDQLIAAFMAFIKKIKPHGTLFIHHAINSDILRDSTSLTTLSYGIDAGDVQAKNIRIEDGLFVFDVLYAHFAIENLQLCLAGYHNIENALAAIAVAYKQGIDARHIKRAMATYQGVRRRFEIHHNIDGKVYIDDYAHHPTEIIAFIKGLRMLFPQKKITLVFQPHLFTRTRDFADGFAHALSLADRVILLEIYPAREKPLVGVDAQMLLEKITAEEKVLVADDNLLAYLKQIHTHLEILATVGAGNIDRFVIPIAAMLKV